MAAIIETKSSPPHSACCPHPFPASSRYGLPPPADRSIAHLLVSPGLLARGYGTAAGGGMALRRRDSLWRDLFCRLRPDEYGPTAGPEERWLDRTEASGCPGRSAPQSGPPSLTPRTSERRRPRLRTKGYSEPMAMLKRLSAGFTCSTHAIGQIRCDDHFAPVQTPP